MMVTGSRSMIRLFGAPSNDIPKVLLSSVKCTKKNRRFKKNTESSEGNLRAESNQKTTIQNSCSTTEEDVPINRTLAQNHLPVNFPSVNLSDFRHHLFSNILREKVFSALTQERLIYINNEHLLNVNTDSEDKVNSALRQETLSKLWSLHSAFYASSSVVFCKAVSLMDSFIAKVKVKPKYAMCVAAACYYIASKFEKSSDTLPPTPESLVTLSRCGGNATDLTRMVEIILTKLGTTSVAATGACSGTTVDFLTLFPAFGTLSNEANWPSITPSPHETPFQVPIFLCRQAELALISTEASCFRPSCVALSILSLHCLDTNSTISQSNTFDILPQFHFMDLFNLALLCNVSQKFLKQVPWSDVEACSLAIHSALTSTSESYTLQDYPSSRLLGSSPPLVWTLSRRTQRSISSFAPPSLATIAEGEEFHQLEEKLGNIDLNRKFFSGPQSTTTALTNTIGIVPY